jgi:2-polyprenyl-3-methyl-5-hydroxy-6-metoxy-1,4-benzoquinol methylase
MATGTGTVTPTLEAQAAYFDKWNASYRAQSYDDMEPESRARGEAVLQLLRSLPLSQPTILEIGCGTGWLTEKLIQIGRVTAIDLSARAIEIAKRRNLDAVFVNGDFCQAEFPLAFFDVVVLVETLSCVPNQAQFLSRLASLIKPGGFLILTSLNSFVYRRRSEIRMPRPADEICNWLTKKQLVQLLSSDFQIQYNATVLPKGDQGILRLVNSRRLNWLLARVFTPGSIARAKEKLGLGHCRVVLAKRAASGS